MQLPDEVLSIVYSKPMTRSDWRTLCPLPGHIFYNDLNTNLRNINKQLLSSEFVSEALQEKWNLHKHVFQNLVYTQWGEMYMFVRMWGIQYASIQFNLPLSDLSTMPGMIHANEYYINTYMDSD
jgi:hypothetical protein